MEKIAKKIKSLMPSKRKLIQLYAALLFNANIKGFINGEIYKGPLKNVCTPGLNCYSCPGASGACPLGSLQNALGNTQKRIPYYVLGILLLYGILLGRFICGFLCPFGLIQELFHKIKTPKLKKTRVTRVLSYFKYVLLVFFVIIVPIMYGLRKVPLPAFCKYICPAGTLEGAFGLLSNKVNSGMLSMLGPLFTWKFVLMVSFLVGSVFIFRFFCRFFCPLGALYGLFNKISVFGIKLEKSKCISCGLCHAKCQMDIKHVGDHECISCGECISVCPTSAIRWKGSKPFIVPTEFETPEGADAEQIEIAKQDFRAQTEKISKRNRLVKTVVAILMTALLASALLYYNFINKSSSVTPPIDDETENTDTENPPSGKELGNTVGKECYGYDIPLFDENGFTGQTFNPAENDGKITVINFWGTWCGGCVKELPYFDRIATEYADNVTVVAVHTHLDFDTAPAYVEENYKDSLILFGKDELSDPNDRYSADKYFTTLGGTDYYPITLILDENGVIIATLLRDVTYDELKNVIDTQLQKMN